MPEEIEKKITALRTKYLDGDSINWINQTEAEYTKLIQSRGVAESPVFKDIVADAQKKFNEISALISNDESLTDLQRKVLFEAKKMWKWNMSRFGVSAFDMNLEILNDSIDYHLKK